MVTLIMCPVAFQVRQPSEKGHQGKFNYIPALTGDQNIYYCLQLRIYEHSTD